MGKTAVVIVKLISIEKFKTKSRSRWEEQLYSLMKNVGVLPDIITQAFIMRY
jgi:hypothetical protein